MDQTKPRSRGLAVLQTCASVSATLTTCKQSADLIIILDQHHQKRSSNLRRCMHNARPASTSRANPTDAGAFCVQRQSWAPSCRSGPLKGLPEKDRHPKGTSSFLLEMLCTPAPEGPGPTSTGRVSSTDAGAGARTDKERGSCAKSILGALIRLKSIERTGGS
jgi:hypothetical protein